MLRAALTLLGLAVLVATGAADGGSYYPPAPDVHAVWSPDAQSLAYYGNAGGSSPAIRVVARDGSSCTRSSTDWEATTC